MCKKLLSILLAIFLCASASAETDYSAMTAEELIALYRGLNAQITDLQKEMQDVAWAIGQKGLYPVTVPPGTWEIGVDIPAGRWWIESKDTTTIIYGDQRDRAMYAIDPDRSTYYLRHMLYGVESEQWSIGSSVVVLNLEEGFYLNVIGDPVAFTPRMQFPTPFTFHE
jgi:hypothetical protein